MLLKDKDGEPIWLQPASYVWLLETFDTSYGFTSRRSTEWFDTFVDAQEDTTSSTQLWTAHAHELRKKLGKAINHLVLNDAPLETRHHIHGPVDQQVVRTDFAQNSDRVSDATDGLADVNLLPFETCQNTLSRLEAAT
jgi:hypothetical protein